MKLEPDDKFEKLRAQMDGEGPQSFSPEELARDAELRETKELWQDLDQRLYAHFGKSAPDFKQAILRQIPAHEGERKKVKLRLMGPLLAIAAALLLLVFSYAFPGGAKNKNIKSSLKVLSNKGESFYQEGMKLKEGDVLISGEEAATARLWEGSRVTLAADSRASFVQTNSGERVRLKLEKGAILCRVTPSAEQFWVGTIFGSVKVVGTEFTVRLYENVGEDMKQLTPMQGAALLVSVSAGTVLYYNNFGKAQELNRGQAVISDGEQSLRMAAPSADMAQQIKALAERKSALEGEIKSLEVELDLLRNAEGPSDKDMVDIRMELERLKNEVSSLSLKVKPIGHEDLNPDNVPGETQQDKMYHVCREYYGFVKDFKGNWMDPAQKEKETRYYTLLAALNPDKSFDDLNALQADPDVQTAALIASIDVYSGGLSDRQKADLSDLLKTACEKRQACLEDAALLSAEKIVRLLKLDKDYSAEVREMLSRDQWDEYSSWVQKEKSDDPNYTCMYLKGHASFFFLPSGYYVYRRSISPDSSKGPGLDDVLPHFGAVYANMSSARKARFDQKFQHLCDATNEFLSRWKGKEASQECHIECFELLASHQRSAFDDLNEEEQKSILEKNKLKPHSYYTVYMYPGEAR